MKITRRKLLISGGAGVALIPLSYALRMSFGGYESKNRYTYLTAKEATILLAIAETIIPNDNSLGLDTRHIDIADAIDKLLAGSSEVMRSDVRLLLWTTEHFIPTMNFHWQKFTKLSLPHRQALIQKLYFSKNPALKMVGNGMKLLVSVSFFNHPKVHASLGMAEWCGP